MTEPNEQYAYFTVAGDFDPGDVSELAGLAPTECWSKGDVNPRTLMERKCSRWSLYSRLERTQSLEDHIADVIEQLGAGKPGFVKVCTEHGGGGMQLVAYFRTGYPGLHFDRGLIESLAKYGLSVDFDFYYWYSDRREDS